MVHLNGIIAQQPLYKHLCLLLLNCYQMGNSLDQWRVCIGLFNINTYICCRKCTFRFCFLNFSVSLATVLELCDKFCILTSSYMKEYLLNSQFMLILIDISNGVGFGVGIGFGLGLRNVCEGCFKTTKLNNHKSKTARRVLYFNKTM